MAEKIGAEALQFGQMLQRYRESAKVTQQEIADATGLTKNYISSIERGVHKCNLALHKIPGAFLFSKPFIVVNTINGGFNSYEG